MGIIVSEFASYVPERTGGYCESADASSQPSASSQLLSEPSSQPSFPAVDDGNGTETNTTSTVPATTAAGAGSG